MAEGNDTHRSSIRKSETDDMNDEFSINTPQDSPRDKKAKLESASPSAENSPRKETVPSLMVASSPPKFVSLEEVMKAASGVSNMRLAHEIVLEDDFQLRKEEPADNSVEKKIKEIMHQAFWDALDEHLKDTPPDYTHAIVLLEEIKENLLGLLLPHQKNFKAHINEVLDSKLIEQKVEHGALDFQYYASFVVSIMVKLCAPVRDEDISKLKEIKEIVPLYKEIFRNLDLMKVDMANFTIQQMKPYIQEQSVEYERKKFNDLLAQQQENGLDGLEYTKAWLRRSAEAISEKSNSSSGGAQSTTALILNTSFIEMLSWNDEHLYPETLVMDQQRLVALRDSTKWLSLVSSILLVTYNTIGGSIVGISDLKKKLKDQIAAILLDTPKGALDEVMGNVAEQVNKEVKECLLAHGFPKLDESRQELLKGQIKAVSSEDHPVRKLTKDRMLSFVLTLISSAQANQILLPTGFTAVSAELNVMCGKFMKIVSHNKAVFGYHYGDIIATITRQKSDPM